MLIDWVQKIENSKAVRWVGMVGVPVLVAAVIYDGKLGAVLSVLGWFLGVFGSAYVGIIVGGFLARVLNKRLFKISEELGERLTAGFSCFGFLFVPPVCGAWANAYLGTETSLFSLWAHFLCAVFGGALFFSFPSKRHES